MPTPMIERRIGWAGMLIGLGLAVQLITFIWTHPLAFVAFLLLGCPLVAAGVLLYLYSLIASEPSPPDDTGKT
jgi:F0F1-type ATP synthase assembly protein I